MGSLLRLLGAVITVLAALGYSLVKNLEERTRIKKCKSVCDFLSECKMQVEYHALPLCDILDSCSPLLMAGFIESAKREGLGFAVDKWKDVLLDGDEEREMLFDFAESFGRGYADAEVRRCTECIERLKKHTETLENGAKTECKTRLTVTLCVSLMAVLFFA